MKEDALKAKLKFKAIIVMCSSIRFMSLIQVICDLVSSKDGTLLGDKRKQGSEPQVVDVIMTNPDLLYADEWEMPRYGPKSITTMLRALFKEHYGFEIKIEEYGKPHKATYDFAEKKVVDFATQ